MDRAGKKVSAPITTIVNNNKIENTNDVTCMSLVVFVRTFFRLIKFLAIKITAKILTNLPRNIQRARVVLK